MWVALRSAREKRGLTISAFIRLNKEKGKKLKKKSKVAQLQFLKQQSCKLSHNSSELLQQRVARSPSAKRKAKLGALTQEPRTARDTGLDQSESRVGPLPAGDWRSRDEAGRWLRRMPSSAV